MRDLEIEPKDSPALPDEVREKRLAWDHEMLDHLLGRRAFLHEELERVNGQIRGVQADIRDLT